MVGNDELNFEIEGVLGVNVEDMSSSPPVRSGRSVEDGKDPDEGLDDVVKLGRLLGCGEGDTPVPPVACRPKRGDGSGDSAEPAPEKEVVAYEGEEAGIDGVSGGNWISLTPGSLSEVVDTEGSLGVDDTTVEVKVGRSTTDCEGGRIVGDRTEAVVEVDGLDWCEKRLLLGLATVISIP